jgi:hypothetical protein
MHIILSPIASPASSLSDLFPAGMVASPTCDTNEWNQSPDGLMEASSVQVLDWVKEWVRLYNVASQSKGHWTSTASPSLTSPDDNPDQAFLMSPFGQRLRNDMVDCERKIRAALRTRESACTSTAKHLDKLEEQRKNLVRTQRMLAPQSTVWVNIQSDLDRLSTKIDALSRQLSSARAGWDVSALHGEGEDVRGALSLFCKDVDDVHLTATTLSFYRMVRDIRKVKGVSEELLMELARAVSENKAADDCDIAARERDDDGEQTMSLCTAEASSSESEADMSDAGSVGTDDAAADCAPAGKPRRVRRQVSVKMMQRLAMYEKS